MDRLITQQELVADLRKLGIKKGDLLNVKISYRSIGKVEGGPATVIGALLETVGESGTIFSDAFVTSFSWMKMLLNPNKCVVDQHTCSYAGAIANAMINYPGAVRSPHPVQKFVAIGAEANLVLQHTVMSRPYSVLHTLVEKGGKNLRIGPVSKVVGVGTTHCAIEELGFEQNLFKSGVFYHVDGRRKRFNVFWPTSCATAFNNLIPLYRQIDAVIAEKNVGNAEAMLTDMKKTFDFEVLLGRQCPSFLKCSDPGCFRCRLSWKNDSGKIFPVIWSNIKKKKWKRIFFILYMMIVKNYSKSFSRK